MTGAAEVDDEEGGDADDEDCDDGDADANACFSAGAQASFVEVCYRGCCRERRVEREEEDESGRPGPGVG